MIKTLSTVEAEAITGLKRETLAGYARRKLVRGSLVGRRWRLFADSLEELVRNGSAIAEKSR
jgi:hypothetical protein